MWQGRQKRQQDPSILDNPESKTENDWLKMPVATLRLLCNSLNIMDSGTAQILARRQYNFYNVQSQNTSTLVNLSVSVHPATTSITTTSTDAFTVTQACPPSMDQLVTLPSNTYPAVRMSTASATSSSSVDLPAALFCYMAQFYESHANSNQDATNLPNVMAPGSTGHNVSPSGQPAHHPVHNVVNGILSPPVSCMQPFDRLLHNTHTNLELSHNSNNNLDDFNNEHFNYPNAFNGISQSNGAAYVGRATQASPRLPGARTANIPALQQAVIDHIRNGEYVKFDNLLPSSAMVSDEFIFKVTGGTSPGVSLVPRQQGRPRVSTFSSWMLAWNNFIRCFCHFYPHCASELLRYQSTICDFASQFTFLAWSTYDRMFRYQMAYNIIILHLTSRLGWTLSGG